MERSSQGESASAIVPRRRLGLAVIAAVSAGAILLAWASSPWWSTPRPALTPAADQSPPALPLRPTAGMPGRGLSPPAPPAAAPVWSVDKAASRLTFRATLGDQPVDGVFKSWDAQIAFDPKNLKASHAMIAVETASALTGEPNRDELLPTANWLWTHKYPKATLVTHAITQAGPGRYQAAADLHIRGLVRRVMVPFTVTINHDVGKMQAVIRLDRTVFSIGQVPGMPLTALAPEVVLNLRLTARKDH